MMVRHGCQNIAETLTIENLDSYNLFSGRLNRLLKTRSDEEMQGLRVYYLEASPEDQIIIEHIMEERKTTELFTIKRLIQEFKNIEPSISSGVL